MLSVFRHSMNLNTCGHKKIRFGRPKPLIEMSGVLDNFFETISSVFGINEIRHKAHTQQT